jgi:hypothetical protein
MAKPDGAAAPVAPRRTKTRARCIGVADAMAMMSAGVRPREEIRPNEEPRLAGAGGSAPRPANRGLLDRRRYFFLATFFFATFFLATFFFATFFFTTFFTGFAQAIVNSSS